MAFDAFLNFFKVGNPIAISHFLAQFIGSLLIILSIYTFFKHEHFRAALEEVEESAALQFSWAYWFVFWGLFLIIVHQFWVWDWPVLITIIGWFLFIAGLLRLFFPETLFKRVLQILEGSTSYVTAAIWLIVGLLLAWWGFHAP